MQPQFGHWAGATGWRVGADTVTSPSLYSWFLGRRAPGPTACRALTRAERDQALGTECGPRCHLSRHGDLELRIGAESQNGVMG